MKKLRKSLLRYCLFSKRLIKKPSFLLLLCIIPVLAAAMGMVAEQESGMLKIVLFQENPEDTLSSKMVADLLAGESVLQFVCAGNEEEAYEAVRSGEADAAWIFPDNLQEKLDRYTAGENYDAKLIKIVEREDTVALQLSRESLYGALYSYFPYSLYQNFVQNDLPIREEVTEEELWDTYEAARVEGDLFVHAYVDGEIKEGKDAADNYLTAPLRGMLSLVIVLCGLAATMYFLQDEAAGVFDRIPQENRRNYLYVYQFSAMMYAGVASLVALWLSGSLVGLVRELVCMVLYLFMCTGFCSILKRLCGSLQRLGTCIPLFMLGMFILCPIFFAVRRMRPVQYLLPPFYYLNAVNNGTFLWGMLIYCTVIFLIDALLCQFSQKFLKLGIAK